MEGLTLVQSLSHPLNNHVYEAVTRAGERRVIRFFAADTPELSRKMEMVNLLSQLEGVVPAVHGKLRPEFSLLQGKFTVGYIVEFVPGQPLTEYCGKGLPELEVVRLITDLLGIAQVFQTQQYILGDIKPDNVIVTESGNLVYVDVDSLFAVNTMVYFPGSPGYTAPELKDGHALPSADLFSIGRTALFALTGQSPSHLADRQGVVACPASVSPLLRNFIERLMALSPIERPDLESALQYSQGLPQRLKRWQRTQRYQRPLVVLLTVFVVVGVVPVGAGWMSFRLTAHGNQAQLRGDPVRALEHYQRALVWNRQNVSAHIALGLTYHALSETERGIEQLQSVLRQPLSVEESGLAHYALAELYEAENGVVSAMAAYQAVEPAASTYVQSRNNLARLYILSGNAEQAIRVLESVLAQTGSSRRSNEVLQATLHKNLGWAYLKTGRLEDAQRVLSEAIQLEPLLADSYCLLAEVKRRSSVAFSTDLISCLQLGPTDPSPDGIIGYILEQL
ncbi:MAG: tetratricopeptide repeat protein [Cyanothece sp. SIO2G6]|nr:tetratricopeptide repeat protein [Cyanothece sp. SIO2G6]